MTPTRFVGCELSPVISVEQLLAAQLCSAFVRTMNTVGFSEIGRADLPIVHLSPYEKSTPCRPDRCTCNLRCKQSEWIARNPCQFQPQRQLPEGAEGPGQSIFRDDWALAARLRPDVHQDGDH